MAGNPEYKNKWCKDNYDRITITVPKGDKEKIHAAAAARGQSVTAFIVAAIAEKMQRENK